MMHTPSASDKPEPTPRPWHINGYDSENGTPAFISGAGGEPILSIHRPNPDAEANAAHIVRCVNAHESLERDKAELRRLLEGALACAPELMRMPIGEKILITLNRMNDEDRKAIATLSERNVER